MLEEDAAKAIAATGGGEAVERCFAGRLSLSIQTCILHRSAGRNEIFEIRADQRTFIAKLASAVEREAVVHAAGVCTTPLVVDNDLELIIYEVRPEDRTIQELAASEPFTALACLAQLGAGLGRLHQLPPRHGGPTAELPWPEFRRVPLLEAVDFTGAAHHVAVRIQSSEMLSRCTSNLRTDPNSFIHGDVHLSNVIASPGSMTRLIDWEQSGLGNPMADLGAAIGSCIELWVSSRFDQHMFPGKGAIEGDEVAESDVFQAIALLLSLYRRQNDVDPDVARRATAGWLATRAWTIAMHAPATSPLSDHLLDIAERLSAGEDTSSLSAAFG